MEVAAWLEGLGLGRYEQAFRQHDIDAEVLHDLGDADLEKLGVSLGHRKRLLKAIAALHDASTRLADGAVAREAERRQLTVMFVDLVGSTALSQRLDPEDMGDVLRSYQAAVTGGVTRFGGHIAKFLGDGVLVYFGWPTAHEDDPERAVRAGLAVVEAVGAARTPEVGLLAARVGIATGLAVVGEVAGEGSSQEEAVIGETPNLAARLQALAEPNSVVVSPSTRRLISGLFEFVDLGSQALKGFAAPVPVWRILGPSAAHGRFGARAAAGLTPLVGREPELALLLGRWAIAKQGQGQVVLLSGEAGIGKSRLLSAFRERLRREALAPLLYQCSPHHLQSALWPVIDQLERSAGFRGHDSATTRLGKLEILLAATMPDIASVAPPLAALLALPAADRCPAQDPNPRRQRAQTMQALCRHVEAIAARQPLVVVLEDAHWSDPTTLELFELIVERAEVLPILLLITFRPEFAPPWAGREHAATLRLDRLDGKEVATLVAEIAGDRRLPPRLVEQLAARTDGVPLFVEELTKAVLESGSLQPAGEQSLIDSSMPSLAIPETLQDSLLARLDRLAPAKEVAQIGAAIGREFSYRLLAAVAPLPEPRLTEALRELSMAELVFAHGETPDATYTFKHALVQDAAYSTLLKSRRRRLHARIAAALENDFPDQAAAHPEIVARHATEAGLAETAIDYWRKAGEQSAARAAMKEADALFGQALRLVESLPAGGSRDRKELDLLLARGGAQQAIRGSVSPECGRTYARARALAEQVGEAEHLVEVLKGLMYFHHGRTELEEAGEAAGERLRISKRLGRPRELVAAYDDLATVAFSTGAFQKALTLCQHALELASNAASDLSASDIADSLKSVRILQSHRLAVLGQRDQALAACDRAMEIARELNHDYTLVTTLGNVCFVDQVCGRQAILSERAEEMIKVSEHRGFPTWKARGLIFRGWLKAEHEHGNAGLSEIHEGLAKLREIGAKVWRPYYLGLLASACGATSRPRAGLDALDEATSITEPAGEKDQEAEIHRIRGSLTLACDDRSSAEACFMRSLSIARAQGARTWELRAAVGLAQLWQEIGERAKARDLLAPVHAWFTEGFDGPDLRRSAALLDALG